MVMFVFWTTTFTAFSQQEKGCYPDCNVKPEQIAALRIPSINWVGGPCYDKVLQKLKEYQDEDNKNYSKLKNVFCSYQLGWKERVPGECQAGGPPPCCPVNHWYKTDPQSSLDYYKSLQKKIHDERIATLKKFDESCTNSWRNSANTDFNTLYEQANRLQQQLNITYPNYNNINNQSYQMVLGRIKSEFDAAVRRGNPNSQKVKELMNELTVVKRNMEDSLQNAEKVQNERKNIVKNAEKTEKEINNTMQNVQSPITKSTFQSINQLNNVAAQKGEKLDNTALIAKANQIAKIEQNTIVLQQSLNLIGNLLIEANKEAGQQKFLIESAIRNYNTEQLRKFESTLDDLRKKYADSMKYYSKEGNYFDWNRHIQFRAKSTTIRYLERQYSEASLMLKSELKWAKKFDPMQGFMIFNHNSEVVINSSPFRDLENFNLPSYCIAPIQNVFTKNYNRKYLYQKALLNLRKSNMKLAFHYPDGEYFLTPSYNKKITNQYNEDTAIKELSKAIFTDSISTVWDVFDYNLCLMWHNCLKYKNRKNLDDMLSILIHQLAFLRRSDAIFEVCLSESKKCNEYRIKNPPPNESFPLLGQVGGGKYLELINDINNYYFLNSLYVILEYFPELESKINYLVNKVPGDYESPLRVFFGQFSGSWFDEYNDYKKKDEKYYVINQSSLFRIADQYYSVSLKDYSFDEKNKFKFIGSNSNDFIEYATVLEDVINFLKPKIDINYNGELAIGNDEKFTNSVANPLFTCGTSTVVDVDNNTYNTVQIGTQCWTQSNLKVSKYCNGDIIPTGLNDSVWENTTSGAYAIYNNDRRNDGLYGKLYNHYAVTDSRGLCPTGWHVPSDAEWNTLENQSGGSSVAGGALKSTAMQPTPGGWASPNTGATNSSGFTALPCGRRTYWGSFIDVTDDGYWWSSSASSGSTAWNRNLNTNDSTISRNNGYRAGGFSVRCVRD